MSQFAGDSYKGIVMLELMPSLTCPYRLGNQLVSTTLYLLDIGC